MTKSGPMRAGLKTLPMRQVSPLPGVTGLVESKLRAVTAILPQWKGSLLENDPNTEEKGGERGRERAKL